MLLQEKVTQREWLFLFYYLRFSYMQQVIVINENIVIKFSENLSTNFKYLEFLKIQGLRDLSTFNQRFK